MTGFPTFGQGNGRYTRFKVNLIPPELKLFLPSHAGFNGKRHQLPGGWRHDLLQLIQFLITQKPGPPDFR